MLDIRHQTSDCSRLKSVVCSLKSTRERGSLLIIALWLIVILAVAAVALGGYLGTETRLMRYHIAQGQAREWARAGVYQAMQRLAMDAAEADADWLGDDWAVPPQANPGEDPSVWTVAMPAQPPSAVGLTGRVDVQMTDEERRLDVNANTTTVEILDRLLGDPEAAKALVDYRDADDEGIDTGVQPPYVPKNAAIVAVEELTDVPQISGKPAVIALMQQEGTVAATGGALNINTVSADVLNALLDPNDPQLAELQAVIQGLIGNRPGVDGVLGGGDDCVATDLADAANQLAACQTPLDPVMIAGLLSKATFVVTSSVFRIRATAVIDKPAMRSVIEAIVMRSDAGGGGGGGGGASTGEELPFHEQSFRILSWREG